MKISLALVVCVGLVVPASAQHETVAVNSVPDAVSWGTAAINPTTAVWKALRSSDAKCKLGQLALSEAIGNGSTLLLKHFVMSPRPCLGCRPDGMPSGHTANSFIGASWNWRFGISFTLSTAELRRNANRHTTKQVVAGALIGGLAELAGQKILRCRE